MILSATVKGVNTSINEEDNENGKKNRNFSNSYVESHQNVPFE